MQHSALLHENNLLYGTTNKTPFIFNEWRIQQYRTAGKFNGNKI